MQVIEEFTITNIRLPKRDLRALKQEALMKDQSLNTLLRELIYRYLHIGEPMIRDTAIPGRSIWDLPGYAQSTGEAHLAERVDAIAYGA